MARVEGFSLNSSLGLHKPLSHFLPGTTKFPSFPEDAMQRRFHRLPVCPRVVTLKPLPCRYHEGATDVQIWSGDKVIIKPLLHVGNYCFLNSDIYSRGSTGGAITPVIQKHKQRLRVLEDAWLESSGSSMSMHSRMTSLCFPGSRVCRRQLAQERGVCNACAELHDSGGFRDPGERPLGQRQAADKGQKKRNHRTPVKVTFFLGTSFPLTQQMNWHVWKASAF